MGPRILVVVLVPPDILKRLLQELRGRYPGARVTALAGTGEPRREPDADSGTDDYLHWGSLGARALVSEIRERRYDLLVVAHGRDYYRKLTYWKAVALAVASRARGKLFCEDGKLGSQRVAIDQLATFSAGVGALTGAVFRKWQHAVLVSSYVAAMGLLLLPVLIGIAVTDLADWLSGARGRASRSARPGQQN